MSNWVGVTGFVVRNVATGLGRRWQTGTTTRRDGFVRAETHLNRETQSPDTHRHSGTTGPERNPTPGALLTENDYRETSF